MSQVTSLNMHIPAFLVLVLLGCGTGTDSGSVFVPASGHVADWANPLLIGSNSFHGTIIKTTRSSSPGGALFLRHCAACHGEAGAGKIGPNIQGVSVSLIDTGIKIVPLMKGHAALSEEERTEIAGYLATVRNSLDPAVAVIDTGICMECHGGDLKGGIAAISCYSCHNGPGGDVGHPDGWTRSKDNPVIFHGKYAKRFVAACANCHGFDLNGGIGPRCSSCHDGVSAPLLEPFSI